METEFDKTKIYVSPSKEMMTAYIDGEWKQFLRQDIITEMEAKKLSLNLPVSGSLPDFQDVIEARIKHFNSNYHTYEGLELQNALNIIRRLVPPIQWKIGGQ